jgi:hypothetical protein
MADEVMTITPLQEQIAIACKEPTLAKALAHIAVWEADRAVRQALRNEVGPSGQTWDSCFGYMFEELLKAYPTS